MHTQNSQNARAENPPDYQFEALLDAYDNAIMAESAHWDVDSTSEREALIEHVSLLQAEIARLKARQITPEMEAAYTKIKTAYDSAEAYFLTRRFFKLFESGISAEEKKS